MCITKPCQFRSITPPWSNKNLFQISDFVYSPCIFAHVRAAPMDGMVTQSNCHPFCVNNYTFMHNGGVGQFKKLKKTILSNIKSNLYTHFQLQSKTFELFVL